MLTSASRCLATLSLIAVSWASAETVTVRSGNGPVGGTDSSIHFLLGPTNGGFNHTFTSMDFASAQSGPAAFILSQTPYWISGLPSDPSAHWIGTNPNAGSISGNSALYTASFQIASAFASATMTLNYSVDDGIGASGDPLNSGVYLNGIAICGNSLPIGFSQAHTVNCGDISAQLQVGTNWLYIEDVNAVVSAAGLLFSATITTLPTPTTTPGANLITNGSFEAPLVPSGGYLNYPSGSTSITGWTVVGAAGGVSIISGTFAWECCTFPAEDGSQWLDLTGDNINSVEGVEQTVATTAGTQYVLSFWVGNAYDPGGGFGTTSTVDVRLGGLSGTLLGAFTNSSTTMGTQVWQKFTTMFTATGSSTTLDFLNADPSNDNNNGLDNVVLVATGPPTPAPQPSITGLSPTSAQVGSGPLTLTINGSGFTAASSITFNGISHSVSFINSSQLTITLTASDVASAGIFAVIVTNPSPGGGTSNAVLFTVTTANPLPAITGLSPTSAIVASSSLTLTINGSGFMSASSVTFNSLQHTASFVNSGKLTILLNGSDLSVAGSSSVQVTNPPPGGGSSNSATFNVTVPQPSINAGGVVSVASYTKPVAAGSIASAFGQFLLNASSTAPGVPWPPSLGGLSLQFDGGVQVPLYYVSNNGVDFQVPWELAGQSQASLTATVNGDSSAAQTVALAPFAPGIFTTNEQGTGQGAILDTNYRLVNSSNPTTSNAAIMIFCTGLGAVTNQPPTGFPAPASPFSETTTTPIVTIGGVRASVLFSALSPGSVGLYQVNAQVPAGTATGSAVPVVISIGGVNSNSATIAIQSSPNPQPSIASISPSSTQAGSGALTLTINGSGFTQASTVTFNGSPHAISFVNADQLMITLSASDLSASGNFPVVVINPPPGGGASNAINFTVSPAPNPKPSITALSPASAQAGSAPLTLTINGTGFLSSSTVTFNSLSHAPVFVSSSQLTITLSVSDLATAGNFNVVVTNPPPGGGTSNAVNFVVSPLNVPLPSAPTGLSPGSGSPPGPTVNTPTPTLSWNATPGATGYAVAMINNASGAEIFAQTVSSTSIVSPTLMNGATYQWSVAAYNSSGLGPIAAPVYFTVQLPNQTGLTGTWQGAWGSLADVAAYGLLSASLVQNGTTVTGTITLTNSLCVAGGDVSGTINGNTLTLNLLVGPPQPLAVFIGTIDATGKSVEGAYGVYLGACTGDYGIFTATKNN